MTRTRKITIIGNSVTLRVRPPLRKANNNYGELLEFEMNHRFEEQWMVINKGFGRATTKEILSKIDEYVCTFPEIFILNVGSVDAPNREIPMWYSDILYGRKKSIFSLALIFFYSKIISKKKRFYSLLRNKPWISKDSFENNIRLILNLLSKNTNAKIIMLGINAGNQRIEQILPGTMENYLEYSNILKRIAKEKNIPFINVSDLSEKIYFPDGVHYSKAGHIEISKRVLEVLSNKLNIGKKA